jgi:peptidoglycan/xylan/chitin deacetylase (PgdA/CDA1 family)
MDDEARRNRREAATRALRRRRRVAALIALSALSLAVVAIVAFAGSSGGTPSSTAQSATTTRSRTQTRASSHSPSPTAANPSSGTVNANLPTGPPGTEPVPILMYHVIAAPPPGAPFPGLYVTPAELAAQMQALHDAGWHAVTLDRVQANWSRGVSLGAGRPIVVSFDNGYHSQYSQALPILRRLGWVGDENLQLTGLPPSQGGLSPAEVRGLVAAGWELDTQGFSHADLIALNAQSLHYQVAVARKVIQQRYGVPANWFCYPSGHYDATVIAAVKGAGYSGSTTVVPGWAQPGEDAYRMHRLRVLGGTTPQQLLGLIASIRGNPPAPPSYSG